MKAGDASLVSLMSHPLTDMVAAIEPDAFDAGLFNVEISTNTSSDSIVSL